jgi:hypothetical protein
MSCPLAPSHTALVRLLQVACAEHDQNHTNGAISHLECFLLLLQPIHHSLFLRKRVCWHDSLIQSGLLPAGFERYHLAMLGVAAAVQKDTTLGSA